MMMGFAAVGMLVGVLVLNWGTVHGLLVSRPDFAAQHVEPVVMYRIYCEHIGASCKTPNTRQISMAYGDVSGVTH